MEKLFINQNNEIEYKVNEMLEDDEVEFATIDNKEQFK